jgi:glyoxylase-like metal-dependent hydrolase (beta-lactamase superfamily II)
MKLRAVLCLCLIFGSLRSAPAAEPAPGTELAPGVLFVPGGFVPGAQPDGNSLLLRGRDGWIVIDTGRHAEHTQAVLAAAGKLPIEAVINTHWHLDHVGGNVLVRKAFPGVKIYASGAIGDALQGFLKSYRAQLEDAIAKTADARSKSPGGRRSR